MPPSAEEGISPNAPRAPSVPLTKGAPNAVAGRMQAKNKNQVDETVLSMLSSLNARTQSILQYDVRLVKSARNLPQNFLIKSNSMISLRGLSQPFYAAGAVNVGQTGPRVPSHHASSIDQQVPSEREGGKACATYLGTPRHG